MSKVINEMILTFAGRSVNEGFARVSVASFAAQLDPTLDELNDLKTAVSEAVTNCIVHAYPDTIGQVKIRCRLYSDNSLEVTVSDRGVGISNVEQAREPLYTTGGEERSGMGFTIMESFTDRMIVRSRTAAAGRGQGTTVRFVKRFAYRPGR